MAGVLSVADLPRLSVAVSQPEGTLRYSVTSQRDDNGWLVVQILAEGMLRLECQRCLKPFDYPVAASGAIAVVNSLAEADRLPDNYDPLLLEERRFVCPRDLIEDELLLALPLIPRHATSGCSATPPKSVTRHAAHAIKKKPFATLAEWRDKPTR